MQILAFSKIHLKKSVGYIDCNIVNMAPKMKTLVWRIQIINHYLKNSETMTNFYLYFNKNKTFPHKIFETIGNQRSNSYVKLLHSLFQAYTAACFRTRIPTFPHLFIKGIFHTPWLTHQRNLRMVIANSYLFYFNAPTKI